MRQRCRQTTKKDTFQECHFNPKAKKNKNWKIAFHSSFNNCSHEQRCSRTLLENVILACHSWRFYSLPFLCASTLRIEFPAAKCTHSAFLRYGGDRGKTNEGLRPFSCTWFFLHRSVDRWEEQCVLFTHTYTHTTTHTHTDTHKFHVGGFWAGK